MKYILQFIIFSFLMILSGCQIVGGEKDHSKHTSECGCKCDSLVCYCDCGENCKCSDDCYCKSHCETCKK